MARDVLEERLDPAFYAPLALQIDEWLDARPPSELDELGAIADVVASAFYEGIADRYSNQGIAFVRVGDVRLGTLDLTRIVRLPERVATSTDGLACAASPLLVLTKGGSVGRVGVVFQEEKAALSRDVLGLSLRNPTDTARVLFYLASPAGRAQVIRGASRQVQAHLTVERLKSVRIPRVDVDGQARLDGALRRLQAARLDLDGAIGAFRQFQIENDPFARLTGRELHFTVAASESLRRRLDPEHFRSSHEAAVAQARIAGWRRLGDIPGLNREAGLWDRESAPADSRISYLPLSAMEAGTGRATRSQSVPVWLAPSRAKWVCTENTVLVPSLLESLDRVGVVSPAEAGSIASSGFHTLAARSADLGQFAAAYLTTVGAHVQILRAGSGVRFRAYSRDRLEDLLLPPEKLAPGFVVQFESVSGASVELESAWREGVSLLMDLVDWAAGDGVGFDEDPDEEDEGVAEPRS